MPIGFTLSVHGSSEFTLDASMPNVNGFKNDQFMGQYASPAKNGVENKKERVDYYRV